MTTFDEQPEINAVDVAAAHDEADAYDEAGDQAAAEGRHDSAELFYAMAADCRIKAERAAKGNAKPRRG